MPRVRTERKENREKMCHDLGGKDEEVEGRCGGMKKDKKQIGIKTKDISSLLCKLW